MDLFSDLAAGAETGWDYSARWFKQSNNLSTIMTRALVPVDLNCILLKVEELVAFWTSGQDDRLIAFKDLDVSNRFANFALDRSAAIMNVLTSFQKSELMMFGDFDMQTMARRRVDASPNTTTIIPDDNVGAWFASSIVPFALTQTLRDILNDTMIEQATRQILRFLNTTTFLGGLPTSSLNNTHQQWDFPNAWPPLQYFAERCLANLGDRIQKFNTTFFHEVDVQRKDLIQRWIGSTYCGFVQSGYMFEKYSAVQPGVPGHGGEYTVQSGFGWTNGVVLKWIMDNSDWISLPENC